MGYKIGGRIMDRINMLKSDIKTAQKKINAAEYNGFLYSDEADLYANEEYLVQKDKLLAKYPDLVKFINKLF